MLLRRIVPALLRKHTDTPHIKDQDLELCAQSLALITPFYSK